MSKIDKHEAPQGYIAVEPERHYPFGADCKGCCFFGVSGCLSKEAVCWAEGRDDKRDVIFQPVIH